MGNIQTAFNLAYPDGPANAPDHPEKSVVRRLGGVIEDGVEGAAAGEVLGETWAALASVMGTRNGQPGRVPKTDTGTHADPITGATVANAGEYRWATTGWKWVAEAGPSGSEISGTVDEVTAARGGEPSLGDRLDAGDVVTDNISTGLGSVTGEVVTARGGSPNLNTRLDASESRLDATETFVFEKLDEILDTVEGDQISVVNQATGAVLLRIDKNGIADLLIRDLDKAFQTVEDDALAIAHPRTGKVLLRISRDGTIEGAFSVQKAFDRFNTHDFGMPRQHLWGEWYLRETRNRLRRRLAGEATQLTIAGIGDSWSTTRSYYVDALSTYLAGKYGDGGIGWCGFSFSGTGAIKGNARGAGIVDVTKSGTWTSLYTGDYGPDIGSATSSTPGDAFQVVATIGVGGAKLFYKGGSGEVRYRWNGGGWASLTLSGTGLQVADLASVPVGAFTLDVEVVSGPCVVFGVNFTSTSPGAIWHKLGASGSYLQQWAAADETNWKAGLAALAPNLVTILHGTNDQPLYGAASYKLYLTSVVQRVRAALPLADILIAVPPENDRVNVRPMSSYAAAAAQVAYEQSCAYLDLQYLFGETPAEYADGSPRGWLDNTLIHPSATGRSTIVDALVRALEN